MDFGFSIPALNVTRHVTLDKLYNFPKVQLPPLWNGVELGRGDAGPEAASVKDKYLFIKHVAQCLAHRNK